MLEVHELEIEKDLAKQASIHQMVCEHVGTLVEALGKIKIEEKAVEGLLRGNLKGKEAAKGGKVTDKDADAAVACDQELIDVGNRRAEIEGMLEKWKGLRESFRQRNEDIIGTRT